MARRDPQSKITALDWPAVLQIAQISADQSGLSEQFSTLPGNYHDAELPTEAFDLILVGNVTHIETPAGNTALFTKLYAALKPGGKIVIFDVFGGQERGALQASLYAIGLGLRTAQGQVYPLAQLQSFLFAAGFKDLSNSPIEVTPYTMGMLVGVK